MKFVRDSCLFCLVTAKLVIMTILKSADSSFSVQGGPKSTPPPNY